MDPNNQPQTPYQPQPNPPEPVSPPQQPAYQQPAPQPQYGQAPQQPFQQQQAYQQPYQQAAHVAAEDPGKVMGIIGLIVGFVITPLIGLILCIIAKNQSKKAGFNNQIANIGVWVHAILTVISILVLVFLVIVTIAGSSSTSTPT